MLSASLNKTFPSFLKCLILYVGHMLGSYGPMMVQLNILVHSHLHMSGSRQFEVVFSLAVVFSSCRCLTARSMSGGQPRLPSRRTSVDR